MAQELTVHRPILKGVTPPTLVAATDVNLRVPNDGYTVLTIDNADVSPITADVASDRKGPTGDDIAFKATIDAGSVSELGPFDPALFDGAGGKVVVTLSAIASVTVGARTAVIGT